MFEVYRNFNEVDSSSPVVVGIFEEDSKISLGEVVDEDIAKLITSGQIRKELGYVNKIFSFGKSRHDIVYLIGLGKRAEYSLEKLETSLCDVNYRLGHELYIHLASFRGDLDSFETAKRIVQTISFYNYVYDECLSKKTDSNLLLKFIACDDVSEAVSETFTVASAIANTRDLVNKPYNYLSASDLANYARGLAESLNDGRVSVRIYNKKEIEELGMGAFLAVNRGSAAEPHLIHLQFRNADTEPIGLVGKGLMYDTGGYTIKQVMNNMKDDMAGAATVLGVFEAAVKNNLKVNLQVIICATDNRISGDAYLPDDVLTAMNGRTIEIITTDAEGRLTLADAVCFAQKEGCREIIDLATLTGAIVVALGEYTTGLFGNSQEAILKMIDAAKAANEELWPMPINDYIRKQVRSGKVADLKNSTGKTMGASGAAAFIEDFIEKDITWLHLDIAGTAFHTSPAFKEAYGATGATLKTVYNYLKMKQHE